MAKIPTYEELLEKNKDLQQELETYRTLIDNIQSILYRTDNEGRILYISPSVYRLSGYAVEEAIGMRMAEEVYLIPEEHKDFLDKLRDKGQVSNFEARLKRKDGSVWWASTNAHFLKDREGNTLGIESITSDITERKRAEKDLQESEAKYRSIFENKATATGIYGEDSLIRECNAVFEELSGYAKSEIINKKKWSDFVVNEDLEQMKKYHAQRLKKGASPPSQYECRIINKKGEIRNVIVNIGLVGEIRIVSLADITAYKQAASDLFESEQKYRSIFENIQDVYAEVAPDGTILEVSPSIFQFSGYSREEVVGRSLAEFYVDSEERRVMLDKLFRHGRLDDYEVRLLNKDGRKVVCSYTVKAVVNASGTIEKIVGTMRDITDRKKMEDKLRESESKFRELAEMLPQIVFEIDVKGNLTFANQNAFDTFGYTKDDFASGLNIMQMIVLKDRDRANDMIRQKMSGQGGPSGSEYTALKKDGTEFPVIIYSTRFLHEGSLAGLRGIVIDISDLKQAEKERAQLISAIEQAGEAIVITDRNGAIQYVNPAFEKMTCYSTDEVKGQNLRILKSGKQNEAFYKDLWETITSGVTWQGRIVNKRKDDSLYTEETTISSVLDDAGEIVNFVAVKHDITSEIELQNRLAQSQKMESIGTLAGGIAHDFNNILSPIMMYSEIALMGLTPESPIHKSLVEIYKAGERARDLVKQILAFARKSESKRILIKTSLIIKEAVKFLRATIPTTIDLHYDIGSSEDTILADPTELDQVIMNLCTNAFHAMENRVGTIEVSLDNEDIDPDSNKQVNGLESGRYVTLRVKDTGRGIDPEIIDRIFDPYFTSKEVGKGTGMGLAIVHSIVQGYDGAITVHSEVGKGTTFCVYLPLVQQEDGFLPKSFQYTGQLLRGKERILIVDDEKALVDAMQLMLERLGYKVTPRTSSIETLEVFRLNPKSFDLVITDMTMPKMTGKELAVGLMSIRSDIPIILCTGYSDHIDEKRAKAMGIRAFVMKPIVESQISQIIRKVLDEDKGSAQV